MAQLQPQLQHKGLLYGNFTDFIYIYVYVNWCIYFAMTFPHFVWVSLQRVLLVELVVPFPSKGFGHPGDRGGSSREGLERNCHNCHGQSSSTRWCDMVQGAKQQFDGCFVWQLAGVASFLRAQERTMKLAIKGCLEKWDVNSWSFVCFNVF